MTAIKSMDDAKTLAAILTDALDIADGKMRPDTTTPAGFLAYCASRFPNDALDLLTQLPLASRPGCSLKDIFGATATVTAVAAGGMEAAE